MDHFISDMVRTALAEDLGTGDVTAALIADETWTASLITREAGVLCGRAWFDETFHQLDPGVRLTWHADDGARLAPGTILCDLQGPARALLSGERTALNFLQTLSGTATAARRYADAVAHTRTRILDTRKTLPGLRRAQKYAVRCGGCTNHRMGLYDGILIKENHIAAAGSLSGLLERARAAEVAFVEIEVETLDQLDEALAAGGRRILLDNFTLADTRDAVALNAGRAQLEASGGITLDNVAAFAETGVDFISIGDITKNLRALDLSLRFAPIR
ncbi:MAG: carboxylating nicotinate-nucleotide diphosphorylase [Gammaproteobacteria bacterium]|nr:carboxylating nicotinate-nucleotide diphosphorylase [Gammaproteobacteria bacterium]